MIKVDLKDRLMNDVFGGVSKDTAGKAANIAKDIILGKGSKDVIFSKIAGLGKDFLLRESSFANMTLMDSSGKVALRFANSWLSDMVEGIFAPTPKLSFTRSKLITTTAVDGSNSEVVENFGSKPYEITIEGYLIDMSMHYYPKIQIRKLRELFEINDILTVLECELLDDMNIHSIYITDLKELKPLEGFNDTFSFKLTTKSIKPIEFFM